MLEQIKKYEEQLQEISREMSTGLINKSEMLLKALEKEVRACFQNNKLSDNDKLSEIQILIYNNLACIFEK